MQILARCAGGDGNLLLNVGPMPTGEIEPSQVEVLRGIGKWLEQNGESNYSTRGGPFKPTDAVASTRKVIFVYIHVMKSLGHSILLPALPARIVASSLLGGGPIEARQTGGRLALTLHEQTQDPSDTIIKLTLDSPAAALPAVGVSSTPAPAGKGNSDSAERVRPQVAVYYFPNYHPDDPRNIKMKGESWSEWELVKAARPRLSRTCPAQGATLEATSTSPTRRHGAQDRRSRRSWRRRFHLRLVSLR